MHKQQRQSNKGKNNLEIDAINGLCQSVITSYVNTGFCMQCHYVYVQPMHQPHPWTCSHTKIHLVTQFTKTLKLVSTASKH